MSGFMAVSSPARLAHARELAAERELAHRDARDPELPVVAARASRHRAAALEPGRAGVARQLRELLLDLELLLHGDVRVAQLGAQLGALGFVLRDQLLAALVAQHLRELGHRSGPSVRGAGDYRRPGEGANRPGGRNPRLRTSPGIGLARRPAGRIPLWRLCRSWYRPGQGARPMGLHPTWEETPCSSPRSFSPHSWRLPPCFNPKTRR